VSATSGCFLFSRVFVACVILLDYRCSGSIDLEEGSYDPSSMTAVVCMYVYVYTGTYSAGHAEQCRVPGARSHVVIRVVVSVVEHSAAPSCVCATTTAQTMIMQRSTIRSTRHDLIELSLHTQKMRNYYIILLCTSTYMI